MAQEEPVVLPLGDGEVEPPVAVQVADAEAHPGHLDGEAGRVERIEHEVPGAVVPQHGVLAAVGAEVVDRVDIEVAVGVEVVHAADVGVPGLEGRGAASTRCR
jgi:hypothetical protein